MSDNNCKSDEGVLQEEDDEHEENEEELDERDDFVFDLNSQEETNELGRMHEDVEIAMAFLGNTRIKYLKDLHIVKLYLDVKSLGEVNCNALGLVYNTPIQSTLLFTDAYLDAPWTSTNPPVNVQFDQKPVSDSFGIQIARKWLQSHWEDYKEKEKKESVFEVRKRQNVDSISKNVNDQQDEMWNPQVESLLQMGFDLDDVQYAIHKCLGNSEEALNILLEKPASFATEVLSFKDLRDKTSSSRSSSRASLKRSFSDAFEEVVFTGKNILVDFYNECTSRIRNAQNENCIVITCNLLARIPDYCPICDRKHPVGSIKPVVCSQKDCIWRYEELGLGASVVQELRNSPEVVDLLISMCYAAVCSTRAPQLFEDAFPTDFIDWNTGKKDYQSVQSCLDSLLPVKELEGKENDAKAILQTCHPLAYNLIRWLVTSNRCYLVKLDASEQIPGMATHHQYLMLMATPDKEARFNCLKEEYGSFYAFHGSPMENWASILRVGLKNYSHKQGYMLHGAAHGEGIYLASSSATSSHYMMGGGAVWPKSNFGSSLTCLALCEVINFKQKQQHKSIYVIPNEEHVMTRYFFIYSGGSMPPIVNANALYLPALKRSHVSRFKALN